MAANYFQFKNNVPEQIKAEVVQIPSTGIQVPKPDLEDDKKRWLVVGICLHSVVSPALRRFVDPEIAKVYNTLNQSHGINTQTFQNHLRKYPTTNRSDLNYEAINNNKSLAWVRGKKDFRSYDYNVQNAVDFSKLFLQTHMAQYTGFNDTCDSSALLGLIINIDAFPQIVQTVAQQVRQNLRNPWAHCNFGEWDNNKFMSSFQMMFQLIKNLNLPSTDEAKVLGELKQWETNGIHFLQGTTLGFDLLGIIQKQTSSLANYVLHLTDEVDSCFSKIANELVGIQEEITSVAKRIEDTERSQGQQQQEIADVKTNLANLTDTTEELVKSCEENQNLSTKVCFLLKENGDRDVKQQEIVNEVKGMKEDIQKIKYNSNIRPQGRVYFYPPDRIQHFVGRSFELELLQARYLKHKEEQFVQVISGLGGCGKSTLAIEFAWQFQSLYPGGIFWFSAESNEILETSVSKLAIDVRTMSYDSKQTLLATLKWLSSLETKWLLVVDNVDSDEIAGNMKEVLMGTWKRNSNGHILITSRREPKEVENSLMITRENCIYLDELSRKDGAIFLALRTGVNKANERDSILELVDELGGLPLALEQAGAFIRVKRCTFAQYMKRYSTQRQKLLNACKITTQAEVGKNRLAVKTTWLLNIEYIQKQSEEEGIGNAAEKIMEIASFLFPDDIPVEILNSGSPELEDDDLKDALQDELGIKQIVEILTRFSLFRQYREDTISVHRLVQEVIRDSLADKEYVANILHVTIKMINKALESTSSPYNALCCGNVAHKSLYLWSKLAANANALKTHITSLPVDISNRSSFHLNLEMANIFHTTAIYHSLHQRQDQALADQEQLLNIITAVEIPETKCQEYTTIKAPLLERDRKKIQDCLSLKLMNDHSSDEDGSTNISNIPEVLRKSGDQAYKENRFHDAIHFYSEYILTLSEQQLDLRVILNRGTLYIKVYEYQCALDDAERCIDLDPKNWKGYYLKAHSIACMVKQGILPPVYELVGLASASVAAELNEDCLIEYNMKINYPIVVYKTLTCNDNLGDNISALDDRPHTTLMLKAGRYLLTDVMTTKSVQIIGIDDGVEILAQYGIRICRYPDDVFNIKFNREKEIHIHFENLRFVRDCGQITVEENAIATFYKCKISSGLRGCDDFPRCEGGKGCINKPPCSRKIVEDIGFANRTTGTCGYAGVCAKDGGKIVISYCVLDRCGGGGVLVSGNGALLEVKHCTIQNMRQMGVEARDGGRLLVEDNVIINNQFHGVAIGPKGEGEIKSNLIQGNGSEGIWCGGIGVLDSDDPYKMEMDSGGASTAVICDNIIIQNGLSGLSFEGGSFEVSGNKIVDNWLWGMMIKSRSSTYLVGNDIFENKCGGIRIGVNYSASIIVDGNTIRDHPGPDIFALNSPDNFLDCLDETLAKTFVTLMSEMKLAEEPIQYSRPPIFTNRNVRRNNNRGFQHPKSAVTVFKACCSCYTSSIKLLKCARCHLATYCSKTCQKKHWKSHKYMCNILQEKYTIKINMTDTKSRGNSNTRIFHSSLKGIREGPPPDPKSTEKFIVKVQSGQEYGPFDPKKKLMLYDRSVTLDITLVCPELYYLVNECGLLAGQNLSTKKIFCWASYQDDGRVLNLHTDNLPPFQPW